ncbi:hypothetical protein [Chitinophaga sp. 22620]|uniref:hypothetical protein n=1 Tax=Chitinophaga sp. 22620 TaxID=3453952 RepID=UPI003F83B297
MMIRILGFISLLICCAGTAAAQAELAPWGNIRGIRISGQLMEFETSLRLVTENKAEISTGKERQRPKYERKGKQQVVTTAIGSLTFTETVQDIKAGSAGVQVEVKANADVPAEGIYFCIRLPKEWYGLASLQTNSAAAQPLRAGNRGSASRVVVNAPERKLIVSLPAPGAWQLKQNRHGDFELYIPVHTGKLANGETAKSSFTLEASGTTDTQPVKLQIGTAGPGRVFDGFGGNFRLQNPGTDPKVIDYCLRNMRIAWGRVEMPWRFWQVRKTDNPLDSARKGRLHPHVKNAMEMAQRLDKLGMPVILSAWSGPAWAVVGTPRFTPTPEGVWGNPLDYASIQEIYRSIGDYIQCLDEQYGVKISMFSFNESDLGINIRQTGEEHAAFIKGLGAHLQQRGLATKMLLGDNSDATTYSFIDPAMQDTAARPYIGAVSFHSWRGWDQPTLEKWAEAATRLNLPLIVGEGSIDAQAWGYPQVFEEETYAREEINLYTRLLNICQPASILQWQLTADYSPMAGGGIFGDNSPLRPTQRFWNLKQLASTPPGLKALEAVSGKKDISIAALGDPAKGTYAIHLVNNGTTRQVTLEGLPAEVRSLKMWVTGKHKNMKEEGPVTVKNGTAVFSLETGTYTTLISALVRER